jgi:hypothetical protein
MVMRASRLLRVAAAGRRRLAQRRLRKCIVLCSLSACSAARESGNATGAPMVLVPEQRFAGASELTGVTGIRLTERGDVCVATTQPSRILVFSPNGSYLRTMGGQGRGPGEFQFLGMIGTVGDSVYGVDAMTSQLSLFDGVGRFARAWRVQPPGGAAFNMPAALFRDGTAILPTFTRRTATTGEHAILRTKWDGSDPDTIVDILTKTTEWRLAEYYTSQPFAQDPVYGISPDGRLIAVIDVASDDVGGDSVRMTLRGSDTRIVYRRMIAFSHEPVTSRTVDSTVASRARQLHLAEQDVRNGLHVPRYRSPVAEVLVGSDSTVWLRASRRDAGFTWLIAKARGSAIARLLVPSGIRLLTIDRGVWGVRTDEDGVPTVVRWRLGAAGSSPRPERHE